MRPKPFITLLILTVVSCQRIDYSEIWDKFQEHEERIEMQENRCNEMNSTITALQAVLKAMQESDYITDVTRITENGIEIGYSITFAKGGTVSIYHGTDASSPKIGMKKASDGEYYWTADDEWITDEEGEMIAVVAQDPDGRYTTPQFRIADGIWYISYDNGNSWREFCKASDDKDESDAIFETVVRDGDYYFFCLTDGTTIMIPAYDPSIEPSSQFKGRIISILGDSISTFSGSIPEGNSSFYPKFNVKTAEQTWWGKLIYYMDAELGINNSWSGSWISNKDASNTGSRGPDRCMSGITRIQTLDDNGTPDIILVYGGANDIHYDVPLGTFDKNVLHTLDLETTVLESFADAYKALIMRLQHYYPYSQIVCLGPNYSNISDSYKENLDNYISVVRDISDYFGTHFIDMRKCGINLGNIDKKYGLMGDVTHPDDKGMELIAKYVYRQICNMIQFDEVVPDRNEGSDVDLFVFAGQSNMMGAAHLAPQEDILAEYAYEYKYAPVLKGEARGKFVYAQHPAGDWHYIDPATAYGPSYLDAATGKSKLSNYSANTYFVPASRDEVKGFGSQSEYSHYPSATMAPYFAKYYSQLGNKCIYAHMAKGACKIVHYFTEDAVEEYNRLITEYNTANSASNGTLKVEDLSGGGDAFDAKYLAMLRDYAEMEPDKNIANKCFVWLQGESDGSSYIQYKLKLQALWSHLQSLGFTHFFILRVGYWGSTAVLNVIKAQTDFCAENDNCYIVTKAPSLIPYPGTTTENWWIEEPSSEYDDCRDSYISSTSNNHFNEKAHKIFARRSADNIHRILHMGLPPVLEKENIKGMEGYESK